MIFELGGRITLLLVPVDPTYPCVSLLNISEVSDHTADGPSGYVDRRVQIVKRTREEMVIRAECRGCARSRNSRRDYLSFCWQKR